MENKIFKYGDNAITFRLDDGTVMTNATEMARPFKKIPNDWIKQTYTERFLTALCASRENLSVEDLIVTSSGGLGGGGGTWFHEDVTMEFARWLAPAFGIWCNDRIKELLNKGYTALTDVTKSDLARMILESEKELKVAEELLAIQEPAADFYDKHVILSNHLMPVSIIAKEFNTGARTFNKRLKAQKIIYSVGGVWVLCARYQNLGYAEHKVYETENVTSRHLYWTEKGFEFIREKIKA